MGRRASQPHPADESAPADPPLAARPGFRPALLLALFASLLAGALFVQRAGRPIEQGGDAYSDGNTLLAGRNFARLGFARLHFLPVHVPDPATPSPLPDEYYTHYPPGPDLINGALRRLGVDSLAGWRLVAAAVSLASLVFWFLALAELFDPWIAALGVAAYALNFTFVWLGDSVHHYPYSDFLRLAAIWLAVRVARPHPRALDVALLSLTLFLQPLFAFDHILFTQVVLFGLGATALRGEGLRRLLWFAAMPVTGFGLHLLQNVSLLGFAGSLADLGHAFLERALSSGEGDFRPYTFGDTMWNLVGDTQHLMGLGLGAIAVLASIGIAARGFDPVPAGARRAARVLGTLALGTAIWFVFMHQHAAQHPFVNRHLLPLASLATALGLAGIFTLAARNSPRLGWALAGLVAAALIADGALAYRSDARQREMTSKVFAAAYAHAKSLPPGITLATNMENPSPSALEVLLDRRVKIVRSAAQFEELFGRNTRVPFLYSPLAPMSPEVQQLLRTGRVIEMDEKGALVEVTLP
jgi:hypothetical protein